MPGTDDSARTASLTAELWRAKWLMLLVFVPVLALSMAAILSIPAKFEARARLVLPVQSEATSEAALLQSPVVATRVLDRFPLSRLYPDIDTACEARRNATAETAEADARLTAACRRAALIALQGDLRVTRGRNDADLMVRFRHDRPDVSVEVLNALLGAYLNYRSDVLAADDAAVSEVPEDDSGQALREAEAALAAYRAGGGALAPGTVEARLADLSRTAGEELLRTDARIKEVDALIAAYRRQMGLVRREQRIFIEDRTGQALVDLKLERADKLARYLPGSEVIKDMDRRIAEAEALVASFGGPAGTVRTGPNPLYQQAEARLMDLQAEGAALQARRAELVRQADSIEARLAEAGGEAQRYRDLLRKRDALSHERPDDSSRAQAVRPPRRADVGDVRIVEPARLPVHRADVDWFLPVLAGAFALLAALLAGLGRASMRAGRSGKGGGAAAVATDLPVLASVRAYHDTPGR